VAEALASITGKYTQVRTFDGADAADPWKLFDASALPYSNDLTTMEPGRGTWINAAEPWTLIVEP
jgi:hypothetical protein